MSFHDLPIRRKVTGVIMLTSVIVLLLTTGAFIVYDLLSYHRWIVNEFSTATVRLAETVRDTLASGNQAQAEAQLEALQSNPNILYAAVYDLRGNLLARYPRGTSVGRFPLMPGRQQVTVEDGNVMVFAPVLKSGNQVGTLYLQGSLRPVSRRLQKYGAIAVSVMCGSLLAAIGMSHLLGMRITTPIAKLAEAVRAVSEREDYSIRVPKFARDEVGDLTDAFNRMLARIEEARQAQALLVAIVQSSDDAVVGKDLSGRVMSWNRGAERLFGYTAAEMIGKPIHQLITPSRPDEESRILTDVNAGRTWHLETVRLHKSGRRVEVSLTISPIRDAEGRVIGVSSIARDITGQKAAQHAVVESRGRLSAIIDSAMDGIICADAGGRIRIFNSAAEKIFRCTAASVLGHPLEKLLPLDLAGLVPEDDSKPQGTGSSGGPFRLSGRRMDGEEFPIEATISHVQVGSETIATVILRDVTEREKAQRQLQEQSTRLGEQAQLLELANVLARDLDDRLILWTRGMELLFGWSRDEALGRIAHELLRTESPEPLDHIYDDLLGKGHWQGELVHYRKDGTRIVVATQWMLHRNERGEPVAVLEACNDITERKRAEQEILRLNVELEERVAARTLELTAANKELEAFTYSVAHDLRAPLRHIDAFSRILDEDFGAKLPAEGQHYLKHIRTGGQNMSRLVDDLLNLARVGRQELKRERVALRQLVDQVIQESHRDLEGRVVKWHIQPLPEVECDPGLMKQVFANLISNSIKYTRPRPEAVIEIGTNHDNGSTIFFVRDNGVGFNMKYIDKLFGVFQRLHRADEFEGTGVGLATVDRIIRKHGGRVWARAVVGEGAALFFTIGGADHNGKHSAPAAQEEAAVHLQE